MISGLICSPVNQHPILVRSPVPPTHLHLPLPLQHHRPHKHSSSCLPYPQLLHLHIQQRNLLHHFHFFPSRYVSGTRRRLTDLFAEHRLNIRLGNSTRISRHFHSIGHTLQQLSVFVLSLNKSQPDSRLRREKHLIIFCCFASHGLIAPSFFNYFHSSPSLV